MTVDGVTGPFLVDTGNSGGIDMIKRWADAHGFPGARRTTTLVARTGAGNDETRGMLFRAETTAFGPIRHDDRVVQIDDPPEPGSMAGLVGNEVLSRCAAVVFDVTKRTLWLEPPCSRPSPESKSGWRLAKKESAEHRGRPWIVEKIIPGGSAAEAGFEAGDRILSVNGVPAELDVSKILPPLEEPAGAKVTVVLDRKGERKQIEMILRRLLAL